MVYTSPNATELNFILESYTAPTATSLNFILGLESGAPEPVLPVLIGNRYILTVNNPNKNEDLINFPILVSLGVNSGLNYADTSGIFSALGENKYKLVVTVSGTEEQCYVEIETWDLTSSKALLWIRVPTLSCTTVTTLYLDFNNSYEDNITYVGITGSTPAQTVWDSNFVGVYHSNQDPSGTAPQILDSTFNTNSGTSYGTMTSADSVTGYRGIKGIDYDGTDDYINLGNGETIRSATGTTGITVEAFVYPKATNITMIARDSGSNRGFDFRLNASDANVALHFETAGVAGVTSANVLSINNYHYLAATQSGTLITLYENGAPVITGDRTTIPANTAVTSIGCRVYSGYYQYFNGGIYEVRISKTKRSSEWLKVSNFSIKDSLITFSDVPVTPEPKILAQILSSNYNIYAATNKGLDVYNLNTEELVAYTTYPEGFTTVGGNSDYLYLGTTTSGIKRIGMSTISGTADDTQNLMTCLADWAMYPDLTSNYVKYIHANSDGVLAVTESGVDYFKTTGNPQYRSYTSTSGGYKCFLSGGKGYYITIAGVTTSGSYASYKVNRINSLLTDWALPDTVYYNDSGIMEGCGTINDIYVTEGTGSNGISNTLFCATSSGVYVIDESNNTCDIYYTTLPGTNNNFNAIWTDTTTSPTKGRVYITTSNSLIVIDTASKTVTDYYTQLDKGRSEDVLSNEDIVDINKVNRGS